MSPQQSINPNIWIHPGQLEDQNTPLVPFMNNTASKFWTSADIKDTKVLGYAYPETQSWRYTNRDLYQKSLRTLVTALYGGNVFQTFSQSIAPQMKQNFISTAASGMKLPEASKSQPNRKWKTMDLKATEDVDQRPMELGNPTTSSVNPVEKTDLTAAGGKASTSTKASRPQLTSTTGAIPSELSHLAPNGKYTEWITNIRAQKHGLGQSFRVLIFLRDFVSDPNAWDLEYNTVGRVTVLGRSPGTQCDKCQDDMTEEIIVSGTVPLTSALLQDIVAGHLRSLEPTDVAPYLQKNLHWRVMTFVGNEMPRDQVPGLTVSVVSTEVTIGGDGVPHYSGQYTAHDEVTVGRPGGLTN
jgi:tyrosinase